MRMSANGLFPNGLPRSSGLQSNLRLGILLVAASVLLGGCIKRSARGIETGNDRVTSPSPRTGSGSDGQIIPVPTDGGGDAELPVVLSERALQRALASYSVNTDNLDFRFRYLDVDQTGDITFAGGKAELKITGLPANQTGDVILELTEDSKVVLRGESRGVTLQSGVNNQLEIVMKIVDPGNGETTDVIIDVVIEGQEPDLPDPDQPDQPDPDQPDQPDPDQPDQPDQPDPDQPDQPDPDQPDQPDPDQPDPIQLWDGQSFQGNDTWQIIPLGQST